MSSLICVCLCMYKWQQQRSEWKRSERGTTMKEVAEVDAEEADEGVESSPLHYTGRVNWYEANSFSVDANKTSRTGKYRSSSKTLRRVAYGSIFFFGTGTASVGR